MNKKEEIIDLFNKLFRRKEIRTKIHKHLLSIGFQYTEKLEDKSIFKCYLNNKIAITTPGLFTIFLFDTNKFDHVGKFKSEFCFTDSINYIKDINTKIKCLQESN